MSKKTTKKLTKARKAEKTTLASRLASLGATQGQSPPAATNDGRPWDEVSPGEAGFGEIDLDGIDIDALIEKTLAGWDSDQDLGDGAADGEIL